MYQEAGKRIAEPGENSVNRYRPRDEKIVELANKDINIAMNICYMFKKVKKIRT